MKTYTIEIEQNGGFLGWLYIEVEYSYDKFGDIKLINATATDDDGEQIRVFGFLDDEQKEEIARQIKNLEPEPNEDLIKDIDS